MGIKEIKKTLEELQDVKVIINGIDQLLKQGLYEEAENVLSRTLAIEWNTSIFSVSVMLDQIRENLKGSVSNPLQRSLAIDVIGIIEKSIEMLKKP